MRNFFLGNFSCVTPSPCALQLPVFGGRPSERGGGAGVELKASGICLSAEQPIKYHNCHSGIGKYHKVCLSELGD